MQVKAHTERVKPFKPPCGAKSAGARRGLMAKASRESPRFVFLPVTGYNETVIFCGGRIDVSAA